MQLFLIILLFFASIMIQVKILTNFTTNQKIITVIANAIFCIAGTILLYNLLLFINPLERGCPLSGLGRVLTSILCACIKFFLLNHGILFYLNRIKQRENKIITGKSIFIVLLYIGILSIIEYFVLLAVG